MWTCGHVDMWTCGHVDMWTCGHVDMWTCGRPLFHCVDCIAPEISIFLEEVGCRKKVLFSFGTSKTEGKN